MTELKVKVKVVLKDGILDPQGKAVLHAIKMVLQFFSNRKSEILRA